jgi:uroporphyrinogen-III synthase
MRLLVTRPEPDATRTANTLRARGHQVLVAPLLQFEILPEVRFGLGPWAGIVVTSANAVRAVEQHRKLGELLNLPLLAVGQRTADVARDAGFAKVRSSDGDVRDLVAAAGALFRGASVPVLYFAGEDRSADLVALLNREGVRVRTAVVYEMKMAAKFPDAIAAALADERIEGVLHYSRRTVEAYMRCAEEVGMRRAALSPTHFCLSREIAVGLESAGAPSVKCAARPEETALMRLLDGG